MDYEGLILFLIVIGIIPAITLFLNFMQ